MAPEAFEQLVVLETDDCVLWPLAKDGCGNGHFRGRDGDVRVHREALARRSGRPDGMDAAHKPGIGCQRHCMNYRHLRWATRSENLADRRIDGTENFATGERNASARLTPALVTFIRSSPLQGKALAVVLGVAESTISSIRTRKTWRHVR